MNEHELQQLTEEISRTSFHREFTHQISYNKRLRSSGGRYLLKTGNIEINPLVEQNLGLEALIGVIKHELCHTTCIKQVAAIVTVTKTSNACFIR